MNPRTIRTATGALRAASPSSSRASRGWRAEPRSSAKIAGASVEATIEPSSRPSSTLRPNSREAARPVTTPVPTVASTDSAIAGRATGRSWATSVVSPPSYRISARATIPMSWAIP